jgi:vitamin B12/bleomycin/antimicrobial peptide transport system ATP-binding/permease protein
MIDRFLVRIANARSFAAKLWVLSRPYWFAQEMQRLELWGYSITVKECWIARFLLAVSVALSVMVVYVSKEINFWNARFFNALQDKNVDAFTSELVNWCILVVLFVIPFVYRTWVMQLLTIRWRRWLSEVYFRDWLGDRTYYRMELTGQGTDNPEQRIEQDCKEFATQTPELALGLLLQVMTVITFAAVLWNLSGSFTLPIFGGLAIPGYLMWAAVAYALVGSVATYFLGRPLIAVNFALERFNADFRYRMVRIRENAESIALYCGEPGEESSLRQAFTRIYGTWWGYMKYNKRLSWLTSFYGQAAQIFPIIVAAPHYFAGEIALGALTQTSDAFLQVQQALSWFVDTFSRLAAWKAVVDRLTGFGEAMAKAKAAQLDTGFEDGPAQAGPQVALSGVQVALPDGSPLLEDVNVTVRKGESTVVQGPSGSGKTTLFRVLAGLWPFGQGRIERPRDGRVLFLPQKPYLPVGSLKDALCYPDAPDAHTEAACAEALEACGLARLASRLGEATNWSLVLSGGEQQRVAFARTLLYRPDWLFLDEATSSLDEAAERQMYELLRQRLPAATLVSVAHRPAVAAYHARQLVIDPASRRVVSGPVPA